MRANIRFPIRETSRHLFKTQSPLFVLAPMSLSMNTGSDVIMKVHGNSRTPRSRVIVITGPTSVGKSATAISLCQRVGGEIISADSVQVYRLLDIGSNKASATERRMVPHHLLDVVDPCEEFTAGDFFRVARLAVEDVTGRQRLPVVVGGTMMYVRWFIHGRPATPRTPDEARLRVQVAVDECNGDWNAALALLAARDPHRATALSRNDWYRLTRALEVFETTGVPMTEMPLVGAAPHAQCTTLDYDFRCIFLFGDRLAMNRAIDRRCEMMILPDEPFPVSRENIPACSILTEVSDLLVFSQLRVTPASPCLAIGYRQTLSFLIERALATTEKTTSDLEGDQSSTFAFRSYIEDFQRATRNYAKQQLAWFRKDPMFHWVQAGPKAVDEIEHILNLDDTEYSTLSELTRVAQQTIKEEVIAQGKKMKTYITKPTWLIAGSDAETRAMAIAEKCARHIAAKVKREELERILRVVKQGK